MNHKMFIAALCCIPFITAAEEKETSPITASAELGMLYKTGNTKRADIKTGFDVEYKESQWRSTLAFDLLVKKTETTDENGKDNFDTSDQKWTVESKTNYTLDQTSIINHQFG